MPYWTSVQLQQIELAIRGVGPFAVAVIAAGARRYLSPIPFTPLLLYSAGAGALWEGVPMIVGLIVPRLPEPYFRLSVLTVMVLTALAYLGLLARLSRLRAAAATPPAASDARSSGPR